jgi:phosphoserine aminotransferase
MKKIFFTVGPTQIYPTVPSHINTAVKNDILSISHRGEQFREIYKETVENLKKLLNIPPDYDIVLLSSALEAMERVTMAMSHNKTFHIITGFFGKTWQGVAEDLAKSPENFKFFDWDTGKVSGIAFEKIKIPESSELVCITQNDTSVGFSIPMEKIYKLRKKYPGKIFALDVVSAVPYVDIEYKYLDAVFFSVQKGFGLPAGLSVLVLSPKAIKRAQKLSKIKGYTIGSHHSLVKLSENTRKFQTVETPNVLGIYLLGCIVKDFLKTGINKIRKETDEKSDMLYSFFSKPEYYNAFVNIREFQSKTTPVFEIKGGSERLRKFAADFGLILGAGYKPSLPAYAVKNFKNEHIRLANFPSQSVKDTKKLLNVIKRFA